MHHEKCKGFGVCRNLSNPNINYKYSLSDFYIDEWQTYVEIKGYETDLDKAKWSQFNEQLLVVRKKEIFQLKKWLKEGVDINQIHLKNLLANI